MNIVEYVQNNGSVIVIDDLLDEEKQNVLEEVVFETGDDRLNWYFLNQTVYGKDSVFDHTFYYDVPFFYHTMLSETSPNINSNSFEIISFLIRNLREKINGVDHINALRGKINLYTKEPKMIDYVSHPPHVDNYNMPHAVLLYFVNDSDGDTVIFNEKVSIGKTSKEEALNFEIEKTKTGYTKKISVSPKKGRAILFDGSHYHASNSPINNNTRCTVNLNLE